ncbi:MAG TPA: hypothetical protein VMX97_11180 [Hyphomicrobiaceae bacterium]|nr:hypothetical protein [Hyphomicrobiaceae bacterium]
MNRRQILAALLAGAVLSGCNGIAIPPDKAGYVGQWRGLGMDLVITSDGGVNYKRISGGGSSSVSAPLLKFKGDDFVVGIWWFTTTFKVNKPPHQVDGQWRMIVEGVELTRVRGPGKTPGRTKGTTEAGLHHEPSSGVVSLS